MKVAAWGVLDAGGVLQTTHDTENEAVWAVKLRRGNWGDSCAYTVKPLIVAPDNLMSHKAAWLAALEHVATSVHCEADRDYWQRELDAMRAMYGESAK